MELHESAFKGRPARTWWKRNCLMVCYLGFLVCVIVGSSIVGIKLRGSVDRDNISAHSAWVKLTGRTDITYEEWMALRRAGIEVNTTTK